MLVGVLALAAAAVLAFSLLGNLFDEVTTSPAEVGEIIEFPKRLLSSGLDCRELTLRIRGHVSKGDPLPSPVDAPLRLRTKVYSVTGVVIAGDDEIAIDTELYEPYSLVRCDGEVFLAARHFRTRRFVWFGRQESGEFARWPWGDIPGTLLKIEFTDAWDRFVYRASAWVGLCDEGEHAAALDFFRNMVVVDGRFIFDPNWEQHDTQQHTISNHLSSYVQRGRHQGYIPQLEQLLRNSGPHDDPVLISRICLVLLALDESHSRDVICGFVNQLGNDVQGDAILRMFGRNSRLSEFIAEECQMSDQTD